MRSKKPWQGRFSGETNRVFEVFSESLSFDHRLFSQDIEGSIAHCRMLVKQAIIPKESGDKIIQALMEVREEMAAGRIKFDPSWEDIHMAVEACVIEKVGPVGGTMHTARSRNDQVATDLRLYTRTVILEIQSLLSGLMAAFVGKARQYIDVILPGLTHLQHAQVVRFSHHLMAYVEMFHRDSQRLSDVLKRVNVLPLGSGALSGTTFFIDREYVADQLKFAAVSRNSMDAVSDRDFIVEFLAAAALIMTHLSRFSEDLIIWNSVYVRFVELPDTLTTGSSMMPQKKNPDGAELIRGKSGRVFGHLMAMLTVLKGLPMTYNRDLQEDKEPLFDTVDTVKAAISVAILLVRGLKAFPERMAEATDWGYLQATDLADYLAKKGLPFRDAHAVVGRLVAHAIKAGKTLSAYTVEELQEFSPLFGKDALEITSIGKGVNQRSGFGMTGKSAVMEQIKFAENNYLKDGKTPSEKK